jgi:hypothetical protein
LRLFQEEDTVQLLDPVKNPQKGVYHFPYKIPVNSYDIRIESDTPLDYFDQISATNDTISLYLKTFFKDTTVVYITTNMDRIDTVELLPFKTPQRMGRGQKAQPQSLKINLANKDELYLPTMLNFSYPLVPADSVPLLLIAAVKGGHDTTKLYLNVPDQFVMQLPLPFNFEPKVNYTLFLKDSLFYGYDGTSHDTLKLTLSKKTEKDYGNLIIQYKVNTDNGYDFIVELLSDKKTVRKNIISDSQTLEYKNLSPGNYRIKIIEDRNKNGKWDTGNYRKKIQPERIFNIDKEITIRGFWDIEDEVDLRGR